MSKVYTSRQTTHQLKSVSEWMGRCKSPPLVIRSRDGGTARLRLSPCIEVSRSSGRAGRTAGGSVPRTPRHDSRGSSRFFQLLCSLRVARTEEVALRSVANTPTPHSRRTAAYRSCNNRLFRSRESAFSKFNQLGGAFPTEQSNLDLQLDNREKVQT